MLAIAVVLMNLADLPLVHIFFKYASKLSTVWLAIEHFDGTIEFYFDFPFLFSNSFLAPLQHSMEPSHTWLKQLFMPLLIAYRTRTKLAIALSV